VNHIIDTAEKVECRFGRNDRGSASRDKLSAKNLLRLVAAWLAHEAGSAGDPFGRLRAGSSLRLKDGYAQDDDVVLKVKGRYRGRVGRFPRRG
jgi:hypothetical protein